MNAFIAKYKCVCIFVFVLLVRISEAQYWRPINGEIPGVSFTGIAASVSSPVIVATTLQGGIFRSIDSGDSWEHVFNTEDPIFSLAEIDGKHFCAGGKGFTYTSSDSGITWTAHPVPFPVALGRLELHPSGALIAGTGSKWDFIGNNIGKGVWISTDNGATWSPLNTGITKQDPLIEALAITPSGTILAGIYDRNVGLNGKFGLMKLDSLQGVWQRLPISVDAPFNQNYVDQDLRIGSVFNININDGQVLASIEGVYINFGYAFSIQKPVADIDNNVDPWKVKWVIDSLPGAGSFYEHITNLFKDSQDTLWASVSSSGNEINNNLFTGLLSEDIPWKLNMDSITEQSGRFLFAEGVNGRLYSVSYFSGNQIFVRANETTSMQEAENEPYNHWHLSPNPASTFIRLSNSKIFNGENFTLTFYDVMGNKMMEQNILQDHELVIPLDNMLPHGLYILFIWDGKEKQVLRFLKD